MSENEVLDTILITFGHFIHEYNAQKVISFTFSPFSVIYLYLDVKYLKYFTEENSESYEVQQPFSAA